MQPFMTLRRGAPALRLALLLSSSSALGVVPAVAQQPRARYPPLSEYLMPRDAEVRLARTAAPERISGRATVRVLTEEGYKVAVEGSNGFVCMVLRGWAAPTFTPAELRDLVYSPAVRAPICYDPIASRTVRLFQELRAQLGMQGKSPDAIASEVATAYALGKLPKMEGVAFAYMWSPEQHLGPGIGAWHPHMMVYAPYYDNALLGSIDVMGKPVPFVSDDAGTPFAIVVIPVHGEATADVKTARTGKP